MAGIYGLSHKGRYLEDFQEYFYMDDAITAADVGKAVEIDPTGEQKVKLATADSIVVGRLEVFEDRKQEGIKVGTVSLKGFGYFPIAAASGVAIGDTVIGAGAGQVKPATVNNPRDNFVKYIETSVTPNQALVVY